MASIFVWIIAGFLIFIAVLGLVGFVYLVTKRLKREQRGDIFLMKKDKDGTLPVEIRAQRDYRYKDAGVDPYKKEE